MSKMYSFLQQNMFRSRQNVNQSTNNLRYVQLGFPSIQYINMFSFFTSIR